VRLRPLTEAECYARCYGGRRDEAVSFARPHAHCDGRESITGERLRELYEGRLLTGEPKQAAA
jgi:hypothetical protein